MIFLLFALTNSSLNFCIPIVLGDTGFCIVFLTPLRLSAGCSSSASSSLPLPPPNDKFGLLLFLFFLGTSLSGSSPSLFSALGLVSVNFTLGLPALPLGSICVSGEPLLDEAPTSIPTAGIGWLLELGMSCLRFLFLVSPISASSLSDIAKFCGLIGAKLLGGLMWCICSVIVGWFCWNISPLWFIVTACCLWVAMFLLCCSSVFNCVDWLDTVGAVGADCVCACVVGADCVCASISIGWDGCSIVGDVAGNLCILSEWKVVPFLLESWVLS